MTVCVNKSVNLIGKEKLRRTCFLNPVSVEPKWHFLQNVIAATLRYVGRLPGSLRRVDVGVNRNKTKCFFCHDSCERGDSVK